MWEAAVAIAGLLAAALGYYLKRAADRDPAKMQKLIDDLEQAKKAMRSNENRITQLLVLNAKYRRELAHERRKNLDNSTAADAAELLRRPEGDGENDPS